MWQVLAQRLLQPAKRTHVVCGEVLVPLGMCLVDFQVFKKIQDASVCAASLCKYEHWHTGTQAQQEPSRNQAHSKPSSPAVAPEACQMTKNTECRYQ